MNQQRELIESSRSESMLDPNIPLGIPQMVRPEFGPNAIAYYKAKHERGECGRYYPLHRTVLVRR